MGMGGMVLDPYHDAKVVWGYTPEHDLDTKPLTGCKVCTFWDFEKLARGEVEDPLWHL